jgi:gliding motility-associated lipoprotein GldH
MSKGIKSNSFLLYLFISLLCVACNSNIQYTDSVSMPEEQWTLNNVPAFTPEITDTSAIYNIFFTLRTGASYPYRNIFLFVSTSSPTGETITDTSMYYLADEKGKWFGKGIGDVHELKLPFEANILFPVKGIYTFRIRHGMRSETLKGVYDIGLRIEKTKL